MANQGQTSNVSSMTQKTAYVAYETKTSQNQNHGHFTQLILQLLLKIKLFALWAMPKYCSNLVSCVNNALLEVFNQWQTAHVAYETKTSQNQNHEHFTQLMLQLLLKIKLFALWTMSKYCSNLVSCVNNALLEVFNFEKLNFSKTTVAYGTF